MSYEIANKLIQLRTNANLSQAELSDKLNVGEMVVISWEKGEASPNSDQLLSLSRLYNVSVNEILCVDEPEQSEKSNQTEKADSKGSKKVKVDLPFIHINIGDDDDDNDDDDDYDDDYTVDATKSSCTINGKDSKEFINDMKHQSLWLKFPYPAVALIAFFLIGFLSGQWGIAWISFLTIPLYYWIANAIAKHKAPTVSVAVAITVIYFCIGIFFGGWHPWWVLFFAIPVIEFIVKAFKNS